MTRLCAALLAVALLSGCTLGPVWSRRLEGRVIDAETGEPVAGALVTSVYIVVLGPNGDRGWDEAGWALSDADGYFALPGRLLVRPLPLAATRLNPDVIVFHPEFGSAKVSLPIRDRSRNADRLALEVLMRVDEAELERLVNPMYFKQICGWERRPFCEQLCQAAYADSDLCMD